MSIRKKSDAMQFLDNLVGELTFGSTDRGDAPS